MPQPCQKLATAFEAFNPSARKGLDIDGRGTQARAGDINGADGNRMVAQRRALPGRDDDLRDAAVFDCEGGDDLKDIHCITQRVGREKPG